MKEIGGRKKAWERERTMSFLKFMMNERGRRASNII